MSDSEMIEIPINIFCEGGSAEDAMWNVVDVIDERKNNSIGDIGIYEFSAFTDFPSKIADAVIETLKEIGEFQTTGKRYFIDIKITSGGNLLGAASQVFHN